MESTARTVTVAERRARLARRHRLLPDTRTDDVVRIADDVLALHSSDPATVFLSAWVRMANPSQIAVEQALYEDRSLVRHHAMRRTLWVAARPTMTLMNAAASRKVSANERRKTLGMLAHAGIADPASWLADADRHVLGVLHEHGILTTRQLGLLVPELTTKVETTPGNPKTAVVAAHTRILSLLGFDGHIIRTRPTGDWPNSAYAWAALDSWLGAPFATLDERSSSAELATLWLQQFGPGTTTDLQWWMGWTKTQTTRALADLGAVPVTLEDDPEPGWLAPDDLATEPETPSWVAVLPSLDATTMGWKQRDWYLPDHAGDAFDRNGNAGCTLWVDGRVVGAWTQVGASRAPGNSGKDGTFRHLWFESVPAPRRRQVEDRLAEVREMVGSAVVTERFPGRSRTTLLAAAGAG